MNEIQLRILIWDVCCNDDKLQRVLTTGDIYSIQDLAVKFAVKNKLIELDPHRD